MKQTGLTLVILVLVWLALSGHYNGLLLSLGAVSCLLVTYMAWKLGLEREGGAFLRMRTLPLVSYMCWLIVEIVKANLDVTKRILSRGPEIDPVLIKVPADQVSDVGRVIHANSITLTPGTLSMTCGTDGIEVHALSSEAAAELLEGEIGRRVTQVERPLSVADEGA